MAEWYDTKSNVKLGGFGSQLIAYYVFSHTEVLSYNETVCLWMTYIYIIINTYLLLDKSFGESNKNWSIREREKILTSSWDKLSSLKALFKLISLIGIFLEKKKKKKNYFIYKNLRSIIFFSRVSSWENMSKQNHLKFAKYWIE